MKTTIMVIVIFKVRTRARFRKPIEERRNFPEKKNGESAISKINCFVVCYRLSRDIMLERFYIKKKSFVEIKRIIDSNIDRARTKRFTFAIFLRSATDLEKNTGVGVEYNNEG